jgi:hypothetical protein
MMSYYYDYYKKLLEAEKAPKPADPGNQLPAAKEEEIQPPSATKKEEPQEPVKEIKMQPNAVVFAKVPAAIKAQIIGQKPLSSAPAVRQSRPREALIKQYPALKKF